MSTLTTMPLSLRRKKDRRRQHEELREFYSQDREVQKKNLEGLFTDRTKFEDSMYNLATQALDWSSGSVGGRKAMNVHLLNRTYERRVIDPITRKWSTVAVARETPSGDAVKEYVFGQRLGRVDPFITARVFGVEYFSPYESRVPQVDADVSKDFDRQIAIENARDSAEMAFMKQRAIEAAKSSAKTSTSDKPS